jgi:hypothetical protein
MGSNWLHVPLLSVLAFPVPSTAMQTVDDGQDTELAVNAGSTGAAADQSVVEKRPAAW